jgi:hypothetical protein
MSTVHTKHITRFFSVERLEFSAMLKRGPSAHCAESYFIDAVTVFKMDAVSAGVIQRNLNLGSILVV